MPGTEQSCCHYERKLIFRNQLKGSQMLGTIVLVILVLMLLGAIPAWPHSRNWGYAPSGGLGLIVIVLLILLLTGRI